MARMVAGVGFEDVDTATWRTTLRLPPPEEFLWQYVASTPLCAIVGGAPLDAQAALEADVVEHWRKWVDDGQMVMDLSLVLTHGRADGHAR
jgi:hypothetical protein